MTECLDFFEKVTYLKPEKKPFSNEVKSVILSESTGVAVKTEKTVSLNGIWEMQQSSLGIDCDFSDSIPAKVPGSVHCALIEAGRLLDDKGNPVSDPYFGTNDRFARAASVIDYTFRKKFTLTQAQASKKLALHFDGVCERCLVWLNGKELGSHRGMFGGPDFDITGKVNAGENTLTVLLYGAPDRPRKDGELPTFFGGGNPWLNLGWIDTAVFNCTYGWHYADIPGLGIWRSVTIEEVPDVSFDSPFITTVSTDGQMILSCCLKSEEAKEVTIIGEISPVNFEGKTYSFSFTADTEENNTVKFKIPDPQLWNVNGKGKQNLYILKLNVLSDGKVTDSYETRFGIRTIEMLPVNGEADKGRYNWTFCINGEPTFMKGTGWCTNDALMRFTRDRYDKFLLAAKKQNVNIVRAWGGGLVETEDFYDLCDEYGIAVFQEWPTAWDSYVYQPEEILIETVIRNVKRLRNRASLIIWCGGNEGRASLEDSDPAFDPTKLNLLGKLTYELDDTRPWHRQEPYAGSLHDYVSSWGGQNPQKSMVLEATFFGEFGVDCWPNIESVKKFTPAEELKMLENMPKDNWEIPADSVMSHHTPMFNKSGDLWREQQHVALFTQRDSVEKSIIGSQLAQVVGVRHTLERARSRWPLCTGSIMYKLNDPYPAASWSTVDWYGSQKLGSFFVSDAFAPVSAAVIFDKLCLKGEGASLPVWFFNDNGTDALNVKVEVFNGSLEKIRSEVFDVCGNKEKTTLLSHLELSDKETESVPLFFVASVYGKDGMIARSWYFANYEENQGCLFTLPKSSLKLSHTDGAVIISNESDKPAVCVNIDEPDLSDILRPDDGCMWINSGEKVTVKVNLSEKVNALKAFNL